MARFSTNKDSQKSSQLDNVLKSRDKLYLVLQEEGVKDAGVGVRFNQDTQCWELSIHTENSLSHHLINKLRSIFYGVELNIEQVGGVTTQGERIKIGSLLRGCLKS